MAATLISEDQDCISKLAISGAERKRLSSDLSEGQDWQQVVLELTSGNRIVRSDATEDVMLCRAPSDEVVTLIEGLDQLLAKQRDQVFFEPSEPSFEISFERTRRGGIKVEAWLDAGNATTGIYTWDACGIRFYTTDANIRSFTAEVKREFGL
jgi:hypothetical protein